MCSLICLSGPDGSGKTTLTRLIKIHLTLRGISSGIFWLRGSHLAASIILRLLSLIPAFRGLCNPYYNVCIHGSLIKLWPHIEFWSFMPYFILRSLLKIFYNTLISDRGVLDFIIWVIATLKQPSFTSSLYGRFLLRIALHEDCIYLRAPLSTLIERADVPKGFLRVEYALYEILGPLTCRCIIDTGGNVYSSLAHILKCMKLPSPRS